MLMKNKLKLMIDLKNEKRGKIPDKKKTAFRFNERKIELKITYFH